MRERHDRRHPPPPHPPPPPPHHHWGHRQMPFPTEQDQELLEELLENADDAEATYRILAACPPEVATVAVLVVRSFARISHRLEGILKLLDENQNHSPEADDETR